MEVARDLEVVVGLDVDPEPIVDAEGPRQSQGGVDRAGTLASHDLADPCLGEPGRLGEAVPRDAERLQELGEQDLPRTDRLVGLFIVDQCKQVDGRLVPLAHAYRLPKAAMNTALQDELIPQRELWSGSRRFEPDPPHS